MSRAENVPPKTTVDSKRSRSRNRVLNIGAGHSLLTVAMAMTFFFVAGTPATGAAEPPTSDALPSVVRGYGDAMERLTNEFRSSLAKRKLLVVWVMDQSETMQDDRDEIMARIDRVYTDLGLTTDAKRDALLTAVVSYGATVVTHTPKPVAEAPAIADAFKKVPVDPSGTEMQTSALMFAVDTYRKASESENRQLAIILVTDESGDRSFNAAQLEQTIELCREAKAGVYVLGREAVFGHAYAYMRWTDPETKTSHWLRIDRGPETPEPEQLQINGFHRRQDAFPAGVGPYEQSRIAHETGGIFFMLPSPEVQLVGRRADVAYDAEVMRPYLPDLVSREAYVTERDQSPLRKAVFQAISDLNPYKPGGKGSRLEVRTQRFPIDPASFAAEANVQIKKAAELIACLKEAQQALDAVRPERKREKSLRWRANYDLIHAQTIAYQARLGEYCFYLAEFVQTPKTIKNPLGPLRPTNEWNVGTVKRLLKPEATGAEREIADSLFRQIIKEHPGTPWALRATEELNRGYGVELFEGYDDPRGNIKVPTF